MPPGYKPDAYIWGLDKNRMPICLARVDMDIDLSMEVFLYEIPDELFNNPEVYYAVPEDIILG